VHGCSAGEVETAHFEGPARGVPGPARDGVVDYCGPNEDEDAAGEESAAVGCGAYCECGARVDVSVVFKLGL
jgi:hypothetical protein